MADNNDIVVKLDMPDFATEAEEAAWWPTQEDKIYEAVMEAKRNGTLKMSPPKQRAFPLPTTSIRLDPADIALAKKQAEAKGLRYQTYLKMIIHEALHSR